MEVTTWEELREQARNLMGDDLGEVYIYLVNDLFHLECNWAEYVYLFGERKTRVDLLNQASSSFFGHVQSTLFESYLLHVSRLTDPATMGRNKEHQNLSIHALCAHIQDHDLLPALRTQIEKTMKTVEFARGWRMKRIAHSDLYHSIDDNAQLPDATRLAVYQCLEDIRGVLDLVSEKYYGRPTTPPSPSIGGASELLYFLNDARKFRIQAKKRAEDGIWDQELDGAEEL